MCIIVSIISCAQGYTVKYDVLVTFLLGMISEEAVITQACMSIAAPSFQLHKTEVAPAKSHRTSDGHPRRFQPEIEPMIFKILDCGDFEAHWLVNQYLYTFEWRCHLY